MTGKDNYKTLSGKSITDVKERVEGLEKKHDEKTFNSILEGMIEAEKKNKNRAALIEWLEEKIKKGSERGKPRKGKEPPEQSSEAGEREKEPEKEEPRQPKGEPPEQSSGAEEREELFVNIKGMEIVRKTPLGEERAVTRGSIEVPLVPVNEAKGLSAKEEEKEISLRNIRNYVNLNFKREFKEIEEKSKNVVVKKGLVKKLLGFKGKKKVLRSGEAKEFTLNHLRSTKCFPQKIGTVAVAFYLKEFLEVRFKIEEELTYTELVSALRGKGMGEELKKELIDFFELISNQIYEGRITSDYSKSYELAEKAVEQLLKSGET